MNLFDYIYVDFERVVSLYSQLTGGVVELREVRDSHSSTADNKRKYDFRVFKHDAGGTKANASEFTETIKPYHSIFQDLENELSEAGHLVDLEHLEHASLANAELRATLKNSLCVKCKGYAVIEDYERIKDVAGAFPEVVALINRSGVEAIKDTPAYRDLASQLEELEKQSGDRNAKARNKSAAKRIRKQLESIIQGSSSIEGVQDWILNGLKTWIDTFLPNIINLRVYPNTNLPDEHIFGHLDKDGFLIKDKSSLHFTYGSYPTEKLSMLGVITSVPGEDLHKFDPLAEFKKEELADNESVENAFRGVFRGFDGIEAMVRTVRHPRVLVHPILVYREVSPNNSLQPTQNRYAVSVG